MRVRFANAGITHQLGTSSNSGRRSARIYTFFRSLSSSAAERRPRPHKRPSSLCLHLRLSFTFSSVSSLARSPGRSLCQMLGPRPGTAGYYGRRTDGRCGLACSTCGSVYPLSLSLVRPQCRFVPCLRPPNERARPENGGDLITRGLLTNGEVDSRLTLTARS